MLAWEALMRRSKAVTTQVPNVSALHDFDSDHEGCDDMNNGDHIFIYF